MNCKKYVLASPYVFAKKYINKSQESIKNNFCNLLNHPCASNRFSFSQYPIRLDYNLQRPVSYPQVADGYPKFLDYNPGVTVSNPKLIDINPSLSDYDPKFTDNNPSVTDYNLSFTDYNLSVTDYDLNIPDLKPKPKTANFNYLNHYLTGYKNAILSIQIILPNPRSDNNIYPTTPSSHNFFTLKYKLYEQWSISGQRS